MRRNEHKRVKHGQHPGDLPKKAKIRMREGPVPFKVFSWQEITESAAKSYRRDLRIKGRSVQRRRDQQEIEQQAEE